MKELIEIQSRLKVKKTRSNPNVKYKFRNCEDILEAVKPICHSLGCILILSDEVKYIGDAFYVESTAMLINKEGKTVTSKASAREADKLAGMSSGQITGATSSYARKYALNGLFCIDDSDGGLDGIKPDKAEKPISEILLERRNKIYNMTAKNNSMLNNILQRYNVGSMKDLTDAQINETYEAMEIKGLIK